MIRAAVLLKNMKDFAVIHITGEQNLSLCQDAYQKAGIAHRVFGFTDEIDKAYAVADLVVSRAGAMTVTELAAFALPAILIPYPYAGGHQRDNALILTQTKMSVMIEEKDLTTDLLLQSIVTMLSFGKTKEEIMQAYQGIYHFDASLRIVDQIEGLRN